MDESGKHGEMKEDTNARAQGAVGDVEEAGETTAADMISGPTDTRPVGADTLVKVAGEHAAPEGSEK